MTDINLPVAPLAPPANAVEARSRLDARIADKDWGAKLMSGDAGTRREYDDLSAQAERSDDSKVTAAMSGNIGEMPNSDVKIMAETANYLRQIGIAEPAILQVLKGEGVSEQEFRLAEAWKVRQMKSPEFSKALFAGEPEALQKLTACNIILSGGVKGKLP